MKNILAILFILGAGLQTGYGQYVMTVNGPTSVTAGQTYNYDANWTEYGYPVTAPTGFYYAWLISNGTVLAQSSTAATVNWAAVGPASWVYFEFETWDNFYYYYLYVTVTAAIPSAPAANTASNVLSNSFTANWSTSVSGATSYKLDVSTVSSFSSFVPGYNNLTVNATSQSVTGLSPGTTYYYRVRAVNSSGTSGNSNTRSVLTLPAAPIANQASSITTSSFMASWGSVASATSYQLDVSTISTFSSFVTGYNNLSVAGTSQSVTGLSAGTTYYYRVRALNASGTSANSGTISQVLYPAPPVATAATSITTTTFTAHWNSVTSATSYRLDVSTNSSFSNFVSGYNDLSVTATSQSVTGLSSSTTYYYRVRALNAAGNSSNSNVISMMTLPTAPIANAPSAITSNSFTANWGAVTGATGYRLDVSTNGFSTFVTGYNNLTVSGASQNVTGLVAGTTYSYRVRAVNSSGASANSGTQSATLIPSAPTATAATNVTANSLRANWAVSNGATSYRLDVSTNSSFSSFVSGYNNLEVTGALYKNVTGLSANTTYYYRVRAQNATGISANSGVISGLLFTVPPVATATSVTASSFRANWNTVTGALNYRLYVSKYSNFSPYVPGYDNLYVAGTSKEVTGLEPETTYYFRVRANNGSLSDYSATVTVEVGPDRNYIKTINATSMGFTTLSELEAADKDQRITQYNFFDGLGRPIQNIVHEGSPMGGDIVQPIVYDEFGREARKYLPFVTEENSGWFKESIIHESTGEYQNSAADFYTTGSGGIAVDAKPYARTIFENSPLNRVLKQGAPGAAWQPDNDANSLNDKTIKLRYGTNAGSEVLLWTYDQLTHRVSAKSGGNLVYYAPNTLMVNKTYDEHSNLVIEYVDKEGRMILKRVQATANQAPVDDSNYASTYYIYDDFGNLVTVLPPEAVSKLSTAYHNATPANQDIFLKNWAFRYKYDARQRMIEKQIPGTDAVYMVYDNRDRLVLTQDGNQRSGSNKNWLFTKYDALNRVVLSGIYQADVVLTQEQMQEDRVNAYYNNLVANNGQWYETFDPTVIGNIHGYDNKSFPVIADPDLYHSVMYYDNYLFKEAFNSGAFDFRFDELPATTNEQGQITEEFSGVINQVTGSKIRMVGTTGWLKSVNYYDDRYRLVQTISDNPKGHEVTTNVYDFTGKVLRTKTSLFLGQPVTWTALVNTQVQGEMLTGTGSTTWSSGAASTQTLPANTDGWAEFTVVQSSPYLMFGLSDVNVNASYTSIDFALYTNGNTFRVYESGIDKGNAGSIMPNDVLRVERVNGKIYYKRNGIAVYTSSINSASSLIVDVSFHLNGGKLSRSRISHTFQSPDALMPSSYFTKRFKYDHAGRLLKIWHQVDDEPEVLLSQNEYNELGQVIDKKLYSTDPENTPDAQRNFKQSVDYRYNIRGWLTSINNAELGVNATNDDTGDLYGMDLAYDNDLGTGNANINPELDLRQFNGNISAIRWSHSLGLGDDKLMAYNFRYDHLNRLLAATHLKASEPETWNAGEYDESGFVYDLNGNIRNLQRTGKGGVTIDNLMYNYGSGTTASNKLLWVTDNTSNTIDRIKGFYDGNTSGNDYAYDANGNMQLDKNKGITTNISYNFLNLPEKVVRNPATQTYVYDATGRKLSQLASFGTGGQKLTEYVGPWIFENNEIKFLQHEEGRVTLSKNETLFTFDCDNTDGLTATSGVTLTSEEINGETFVKVTAPSGASLLKRGVMLDNVIDVVAGDRYTFRVKGYRNTQSAQLYVIGNGTDLIWPGAALGQTALREMDVEQTFTIPPGVTQLTLGILWYSSNTAGDYFRLNRMELQRLSASEPEYQYNLKDHLGNVRLTFTTKDEVETDVATLETESNDDERTAFLHYDEAVVIDHELFDHTSDGGVNETYNATRLVGGDTDEKVGLVRSLSVMPGDEISMEVWAKYLDPDPENWQGAFEGFLTQYASGGAPAGTIVDGGFPGSLGNEIFPYATLLNRQNVEETAPKAFLTWLVFDRDFNPLIEESGFIQIGATGTLPRENGTNVAHERLRRETQLKIKQPGYVYIYISNENETPVEVFFDDFKVEHIKSPVVQMDDYYPFGLTFNSYQRENSVLQDFNYNSKEKQNELALDWLDYGARMYMPDIGKFNSIDIFSGLSSSQTPYSYAGNDPVNSTDMGGNFQFPVELRQKYPKVTAYLEKVLPHLQHNQVVVNTIDKHTHLGKETIKKDFQNGSGPVINPKDLLFPNWGRNLVIGRLDINEGNILQQLENGLATSDPKYKEFTDVYIFMTITVILHEYVHEGSRRSKYKLPAGWGSHDEGSNWTYEAFGRFIDWPTQRMAVENDTKNKNIAHNTSQLYLRGTPRNSDIFMGIFFTSSPTNSNKTNQKETASPYHPHKFNGNE